MGEVMGWNERIPPRKPVIERRGYRMGGWNCWGKSFLINICLASVIVLIFFI